MKSLFLLIILVYVCTLVFSAFVAAIRFFIDVGKWHKIEKRAVIKSSIENYYEEGEKNGRVYNDRTGTGDNTGTGDDNTGDNTGDDTGTGDRKPLEF